MHLECECKIVQILRGPLRRVLLSGEVDEAAATRAVEALIDQLEVTDCPPEGGALLTTAIPFQIVHTLREILGGEGSGAGKLPSIFATPLDVARWFVEELTAAGAGSFVVAVGGGGHLNITPSREWRFGILSRIALEQEAFLHHGVVADWNRERIWPRAIERALSTADPDLCDLANRTELDGSREHRLMLAGALADEELDVQVYLRGHVGKENVPWYLSRVEGDLARFAELIEVWRVRLNETGAGSFPGAVHHDRIRSAVDTLLDRWCLVLLGYRRAATLATRRSRPELLVRHLLEIGAAFYGLFQRPQYRDRSRIPPGGEDLDRIAVLGAVSSAELVAADALLFRECGRLAS